MKRLMILIVLTLLSQTANAVLEGRHVHFGDTIELHFDNAQHNQVGHHSHDEDEHKHAEGESCLHHHCSAGHFGVIVKSPLISSGCEPKPHWRTLDYTGEIAPPLDRPPIA